MDGCQLNQYSNVSKHLRNLSQMAADSQNNTFTYAPDTGAANAYVMNPQPAIGQYTVGQRFAFRAANPNSGASTLNVNGLGAVSIIKSGSLPLGSGDIAAGQVVEVTYDGTYFQIPNISGGGGGGNMNNPMSTLGDMIYGGASGAATRLAGDTSNLRKFLREQSSGGVAAAPAWDTIQAGDIPFPVFGYQNLKIQNNATTPATKIDISADFVALFDGSVPYVAASPSVTIDFTASAANGLDTGSLSNGNWYYFWLIYNGTTVAGLGSLSSTAPTMPSGYTYKRRLGAMYYTSSAFYLFQQLGKDTYYNDDTNTLVVNGGSPTSWTTVNPTSLIPPTATSVYLLVENLSGAGGTYGVDTYLGYDGSHIYADFEIISVGAGNGSTYTLHMPLQTAQTFYYYNRDAGGHTDLTYISILGFGVKP